jgi:phenylacetate-CoA ligase
MKRLSELLLHAVNTVPFYAELQRRKGTDVVLSDFPIIGKREYVAHLDELMSTAFADYERVTDHGAAGHPKALFLEFTSGSSGYPLRCYKTRQERTQLAISLLKKRKAIDPTFSMERFFGFIHNLDYPSTTYADSLGNLSENNIGRVLTYLRDVARPAFLHGNPMLLLYYANYIQKHQFDLGSWRISFIESVSESLSREDRRHISEQFRTAVVDCYGCLEAYNVAYECQQHRMHLNENVVVEILDPQTGEDLTRSGRQGEVILTALVNRAQPFIRYRTGDIAHLQESDCPCGNRNPLIHLSGHRKIDYIKLLYKTTNSDLTICGYDIFYTVMHRLIAAGLDHVEWFNVIQKELDLFEVLYIPKVTFSERFFEVFRQEAQKELGGPARFEFSKKDPQEVLLINRKNRVFRSLLQSD